MGRALIAGPPGVHAHGDVGRLLVDGRQHGAGVAIEAVVGAGVADLADGLADQARDVHVGLGGDLAGQQGHAGGDQGLAGHASSGILGHDRVDHGVGDLIGDLVGVALGHRFAGEQETLAHPCSFAVISQ
jgi:hypothetical protein